MRWTQLSVTSSCDLWIIFVINIGIVIMKWLAQYLVSEPSSLWSRLIFSAYTGPAPGPRPGLAQHKPVSVRRSFQSAPSSPLLCWQLSVSVSGNRSQARDPRPNLWPRLASKCDMNDFTRWLISCEKCQGPGVWVRMSEECRDCHCDNQLTRPD